MTLNKTRYVNRSGPYQFVSKNYSLVIPHFLKGLALLGNVFFVHSSGSATTGPNTPEDPIASIDTAVGLCTANNNDVIVVLPGHAETVSGAAGIALDVAGITVVGLGRGAARPTITMSAVGSTVTMAAASITIYNLLFISTAACTIVLDINAADCWVDTCEFRYSSGTAPVVWIDINGGAANACDRTKITSCLINTLTNTSGSTGAGIELGEVADDVQIRGTVIIGDWGDASIHNPTGKVLTDLTIADCELTNYQTGDHSIELVSACTGNLIRNMYHNNMTQATGSDPGSCFTFECYHDDVIDTSAIVSPAVT